MKYYRLLYDYNNDNHYINCDKACIGELDKYCLMQGIPQSGWSDISFSYNSYEGSVLSDYAANIFTWVLVSERFCKSVNKDCLNLNVQFLPVQIIDRSEKNKSQNYYALNVLDVVKNAIDFEKSKYSVFELEDEKIYSFQQYVLKKEMINGYNIFRINEDNVPIFVSQILKEKIIQNEMIGFSFREITVV